MSNAYATFQVGNFDRTESIEFQAEMVHLGTLGLSLKECGDYYGLDPDDWIEWCEEHPITEARHNCGKARGIALAGEKLMNEIKAGKINAITFYLKTQGNFLEKSAISIEENLKISKIPLPPIPVDPVEAAKVYKQFMQSS
jgi:hypothetical protein